MLVLYPNFLEELSMYKTIPDTTPTLGVSGTQLLWSVSVAIRVSLYVGDWVVQEDNTHLPHAWNSHVHRFGKAEIILSQAYYPSLLPLTCLEVTTWYATNYRSVYRRLFSYESLRHCSILPVMNGVDIQADWILCVKYQSPSPSHRQHNFWDLVLALCCWWLCITSRPIF